MLRKICIVSSGQPSANPRLVKEAVALTEAGYKVQVIYCPLSPWADLYDGKLFQLHSEINWVKAGFHPLKEKWQYLFARLRQKCNAVLYKFFGNYNDFAICSSVLFAQELKKETKKSKADLYIGHNLGALPAVIAAAWFYNTKASFDFEDFHRGEDKEGSQHWIKTKQTEETYIPQLSFATAASPLIAASYQSLFPHLPVTVINNCFPLSYGVKEQDPIPATPLKLFWFSQFIGKKRGLETVLEAIGKIGNGKVQVSLLGNCTSEIKKYFQIIANENKLKKEQLNFLAAVEENKIAAIASAHHIGLACEVPHILNRNICLTNKVFMYLLAGNAILFSNTKAQALFLNEHQQTGVMYEQNNTEQLVGLLQEYMANPILLQQHRNTSKRLGMEKLNWEAEKQILLKKINESFENK